MKYINPTELSAAFKTHKSKLTPASQAKIGDAVKYAHIIGIIGEITDRVFIWHNDSSANGACNKHPKPETDGKYIFSYMISPNSMINIIRLGDLKPLTKKRYIELIKENLYEPTNENRS